ncbi:hypothetical protein CY34DRAFT_466528 [Suillus luteus UH-Slu-Lm8-n1]|uniref:Uncharacterized protein n=1 Tax=Suillus luteus UH-Slu-Lm8-n1 TaxID=930992 RepID=A0A0D0B8D5_9AGAM|nr:hypothetical protein CY34DRAFT_466528 [Suillus luteus UH-Slu-Lm8-n1]
MIPQQYMCAQAQLVHLENKRKEPMWRDSGRHCFGMDTCTHVLFCIHPLGTKHVSRAFKASMFPVFHLYTLC